MKRLVPLSFVLVIGITGFANCGGPPAVERNSGTHLFGQEIQLEGPYPRSESCSPSKYQCRFATPATLIGQSRPSSCSLRLPLVG